MSEKSVWEALDSLQISFSVAENANRFDKTCVNDMEKGLETNDINRIYNFIRAMENGRGLPYKKEISELIKKAYNVDPRHLAEYISNRNSLLYYWVLLSYCTKDMLQVFSQIDLDAPLFFYECARQLINEAPRCEAYKDAIKNCVIHFAKKDSLLWKQWICRNESSQIWQRMYGEVLFSLDKQAAIVWAESINLEIDEKYLGNITQTFEAIEDNNKFEILSNIGGTIYLRWTELLNENKRGNHFQKDILISGYTNIVIFAMAYYFDTDVKRDAYLLNCLKEAEEDAYKWSESSTQYTNVLLIDMTQIFYALHMYGEDSTQHFDDDILKYLKWFYDYIERMAPLLNSRDNSQAGAKLNQLLEKFMNQKNAVPE